MVARRRRERLLGMSTLPWGGAALVLALSALLAVWLLLEPWLIRDLPTPARLAMVVLGVWALGGGLSMPLHFSPVPGWWRLAGAMPWYPLALVSFIVLLLCRYAGLF